MDWGNPGRPVAQDLKADLDISTGDGRISLTMPVTLQGKWGSSHVRGALNGGGADLLVRSEDGSIDVHSQAL